ncbi:MAG: hypothetical protein KJ831_14370, partial [Candidatus Eisenbacteria bacterium]|nr:hypothetical protein [Candidatus Eisenbacteria bacterium]
MNRILKISCALLPGLLAAGCSFEEPQAPSFETNIYIPLGTERATGLDLLEEENISGDSTGVEPLQFSMKGGLDRFEAAALLDLTLSPAHFSSTISDIGIEPPEEIRIDYTLGDLSGLSLPPGGTHLIVEPFTFSPVRTELSDQETFEWIRLAQGRIDIQITNDLAVPVGGGSGDPVSLSLSLWNRDVEEKAFEVSLVGGLAPAQTATWSVDLSGIDLRDRLDIEFGGGSSGSGGDPVWVEAAQSLGISLLFHDLEPDSVIAAVGPQYAAVTGGVALPGDIRIDEGEIQEGLIHLQVQNELPLQAYADLTFPELWNERGDNITQRIALPSSQSGPDGPAEVTIDLAGAIWGSASGAVGDTLHYQLDIETM